MLEGPGGGYLDWARYMSQNHGTQKQMFDALLETAREIDYRYGSNALTHDLWQNLIAGNFRVYP